MRLLFLFILPVISGLFLSSCSDKDADKASSPDNAMPAPAPSPLEPGPVDSAISKALEGPINPSENLDNLSLEELLQKALKATNPDYNGQGQIYVDNGKPVGAILANTGIENLEALEGIPFMSLDLQGCPVSDLTPLKGMPLVELFLDNTKVQSIVPIEGAKLQQFFANGAPIDNIEVLAGMPLVKINLFGTQVKDIRALEGAPLQEVWLNETLVEDISPLAKSPLITVTLHRTKVKDLSPLANHKTLQRLHIGECEVEDLTPLLDVPLMRLIFTPSRIRKGIPEVREKITTLRELGVEFETKMNPYEFWRLYDEGAFAG